MTENALPQPAPASPAPYWPGYADKASPGEATYARSGKSLKDLISCYKRRTDASARWRASEYDKTWTRMIDLYRGKQLRGVTDEDRIVINIAFSTVNVIVPSLAVNEPNITINPRAQDQEQNAAAAEGLVNYWWRHFDWKSEIKRSAKDSISLGHGWAKVGWAYSEIEKDRSPEDIQAEYAQQRQEADLAAFANPAIAADLPSDEDIYEGIEKSEWEAEKDHPFLHRVSPYDMLVDPEATYVGDLKWVCQKIVSPIESVAKDERYEAKARNALKPDMAQNPRWRDQTETDARRESVDDDIKRVTLYEYWDIEHDYYCVFAKDAKDFLVKPTANPYPFAHPFFFLPNYEVTDQFYPIGDLEMVEPIQHELNGVRSDMMNHRKRWQRAYLYLRDKVTPEALAVLGSDEDGRMIPIEGDEELARLVQPLQQISLDPQMYNYSETIENDLDLVSGVTEYQRGSAPEIRRTATEASLLQNATNARVSDKLAQIEHFMSDIAEAIIQLAQMYMTKDEVARLVRDDGEVQWGNFTPEAIQGEFDFTVEAGSTTPKDENMKRQEALNLFQAMAPYVGEVVDPKALVAYVLRNGFGVKNPDMFFPQAPPPEQNPMTKLIETINYKDAPESIKRQIEAQAGFQPATEGEAADPEAEAQRQHDAMMQGSSQAQEAATQQQDQQHELMMQQLQMEQQQQAQEAAAQQGGE